MRRLATLLMVLAALALASLAVTAAPATAAGGASIGTMVDEDGGSGCIDGSLFYNYTWKWIAYLDGGGYYRVWADVWLCTRTGWVYVGGYWTDG